MMAERGVPIKLEKYDGTLYTILFFILLAIIGMD
jgi:hypothetical protein